MRHAVAARTIVVALVVALSISSHGSFEPPNQIATAADPVIVRVAPGTAAELAAVARRLGATDIRVFAGLDMVAMRIDPVLRAAVGTHRATRSVSDDRSITIADDDGDADDDRNGRGDSPGRSVVLGRSDGDDDDDEGVSGRGVTVAVIDTGIADHPDLRGKVAARVDFVRDGAGAPDPGGHGTHIAGLIAGRQRGSVIGGIAPEARLIDLRVLGPEGRGTVSAALAAFEWVLRNRKAYGIKVVNVSWGASHVASYHDDPLTAAVEAVWLAGITVVVAAGNDGPRPGSVTSPGADPFVVTVGSLEDQGTVTRADDVPSSFGGKGPTRDGFAKPDVLAPGRKVVSLRAQGSKLEQLRPERIVSDGYARMSGTSVATAFAAGTAALLLEATPSLTPAQVKGALVAGARTMRGSPAGALDADRALVARGRANSGLAPSRLLLRVVDAAGSLSSSGDGKVMRWENITWENITWENITWENLTWENVTWENLTWENITWERIANGSGH